MTYYNYNFLSIVIEEDIDQDDSSRLRCETFDIERVLEHGAHLMGSEGHEYDLDEETLSATGWT